MTCVCNVFEVIVGGGLVIGSSAVVSDTIIRGGVTMNGSALTDVVNHLYDNYAAVWPLDEFEAPYEDRCYLLQGTLADGSLELERVDGIGCLYAQSFTLDDETQIGSNVTLEQDFMESESFTTSFWFRPLDVYRQGIIFQRGSDPWSFKISYSFLNHIIASMNVGDSQIDCFSHVLEADRWYHIGIVVDHMESIKIYVNGVLSTSEELTLPSIEPEGDGSFGSFSSYPVAMLQEFRLWPETRSVNELIDEKNAWCGDFVLVGEVVEI